MFRGMAKVYPNVIKISTENFRKYEETIEDKLENMYINSSWLTRMGYTEDQFVLKKAESLIPGWKEYVKDSLLCKDLELLSHYANLEVFVNPNQMEFIIKYSRSRA